MTRPAIASMLALLLLGLASEARGETLRLSGASQVFAGIFFPHKSEIERTTGLELQLRSSRSIDGIRDLLAGKSDLAMISNDLKGIADAINAGEPGTVQLAGLVEHEIGETEVSFIVHAENPVSELKREPLAALLAGRIDNWSAVGGRNEPVLVIAAPSGGIYPDIEDQLLKPFGWRWARNASSLANVVFTTRAVSQTRNAISYMGALTRDLGALSVKPLKTDIRIAEPLSLVTLGAPSPAARRVIDAAQRIGQR